MHRPIDVCAAQGFHHFQVIVDLMHPENRLGAAHGMRKQNAAAVGIVTRADANTRGQGDNGRLDGVLQQDGGGEFLFPQDAGQAENAQRRVELRTVGDDFIRRGKQPVDVGDRRLGQNSQMGLGIGRADGRHRGQRHDGVADPVGAADQDTVKPVRRQFFSGFQNHVFLLRSWQRLVFQR